ncbi:MAG: glycosyltransferase family 4 protein [Patescibacteria group bacterium]
MKILVFSWRDPKHPLAGGAEQVMHEHMKGWVKAGHTVTLFSSSIKGEKQSEVLDGVRIVRGGYQYLGVQLAGLNFYLTERKNFDLIIDQFHGIPFFTPLYARKPKVAVIQESARYVWFLNPLPWPFNYLVGLLGYLIEPFVFLLYKGTPFITGSNSAKEDVANFGIPKKSISVIPHGVLIQKTKKAYKKERVPAVCYLGVLSKDKGIEKGVKAFKLLGKGFQFWVIGKAETRRYAGKVKKLVRKLGLERKIKFWGFVNRNKKFELLAKAHVLINPSAHEGWGLVNIEANAVGTPVVAYRNPGLVDSVNDGVSGILTNKNTPEELAIEITELLRDERIYKRMCETARAWSKNFSWEKSKALSLKVIERLYEEKR